MIDDQIDDESFNVSDEALESAGAETSGPSANHGTGTMAMGCCG
jgi:hypothetical protein